MPDDTALLQRIRALETALDQTKVIERAITRQRVRAINSVDIAIASGVNTALTFDAEAYDTAGMHSISVNTGRLTSISPGLHMMGATVRFQSNATGYRQIFIRHSVGAAALASLLVPAVSGQVTDLTIATSYEMQAGEYIELVVGQNSGVPLNVQFAAVLSPSFWMARIA